jgi:uncharacterized protein
MAWSNLTSRRWFKKMTEGPIRHDDFPETSSLMWLIYIDADACPVKDEVYRVAERYAMGVRVVANNPMRVPINPLIELVVRPGFGTADDWIAQESGPGDVVITADIPLAARCLDRGARVLDQRGRAFTDSDIGGALATRELMETLRQTGQVTGGPAALTRQDRSRFLAKLDETVNAIRRAHPRPSAKGTASMPIDPPPQ